MLRWKIICVNEVYKFSSGHFSTGSIFYILIFQTLLKIKNSIFQSKYAHKKIVRETLLNF